jgi:hypothetical protein
MKSIRNVKNTILFRIGAQQTLLKKEIIQGGRD